MLRQQNKVFSIAFSDIVILYEIITINQLKYYEAFTENYNFRFSIFKLSDYTEYYKAKIIDIGEKV